MAMKEDPIEVEPEGFAVLPNAHKDMVETCAFNPSGDRFASGAVDGRIKVYNRHSNNSWHECDTWRAHSSEVLQLQWLPSTIHPNLIASIGTDGKFKLWLEDPTLPPSSGRRFNSHSNKPLYELRSSPRAPYLSFSIKHDPETRHTYLALINRLAVVIVYENEEPENLGAWNEIDHFNCAEKAARGDEVSFRVQFDPNLEPCYTAIRQGVARDALSLIVASMGRASIWRTKEIAYSVSLGQSTTREFYLAAELKGHKGLVRDVAWAPGNIRGYDVVATACKDGYVRVYNLSYPPKSTVQQPNRTRDFARAPERTLVKQRLAENGGRNMPSGIGAGLAGARPMNGVGIGKGEGEVATIAREMSRVTSDKAPVWRVGFDADGQLLASVGDDGKLVMWRREPSGVWSRSSELAMTRSVMA